MHVLPAKHSEIDYQESLTTGQTDDVQYDTYVPLCLASDTITVYIFVVLWNYKSKTDATPRIDC